MNKGTLVAEISRIKNVHNAKLNKSKKNQASNLRFTENYTYNNISDRNLSKFLTLAQNHNFQCA